MKLIGYSAVIVAFFVGWVGAAICVRRFITNLIPDAYDSDNVLLDWLELPGSVLGLPVGFLLAYMVAAPLKSKGPR